MQHVLLVTKRLRRSDEGQDLVEYGMLAMLIAVAAVVAVGTRLAVLPSANSGAIEARIRGYMQEQ